MAVNRKMHALDRTQSRCSLFARHHSSTATSKVVSLIMILGMIESDEGAGTV